jgi:2-dehydro-3-deoxyphosphogluconate aldolase/(4S)-4-hydroxy-2-oxoglutarate aldolase
MPAGDDGAGGAPGAGGAGLGVAEALFAGGVTALEFTLTTPGALPALEAAAARDRDRLRRGAGTVLDAETARTAILAGADLITLFPATTVARATSATCWRRCRCGGSCRPAASAPTTPATTSRPARWRWRSAAAWSTA